MNKRFLLLVLTISIISLGSDCNDCRECPPPPSINGDYLGRYEFVEIHHNADTVRSLGQPVRVKFRKPEFSFELTPGVPESLRVVCDIIGEYELGKGVNLKCTVVDSTNDCADSLLYPQGVFGLDQITDTLRMIRDTTTADTVRYIKKLALLPVLL
ncbi:MAG: hypothetical protein NTW07_12565 [candidate division Zixibacteria bacterium]|nr:hypothetical protein [candidate division Zixibacteria bacterium]